MTTEPELFETTTTDITSQLPDISSSITNMLAPLLLFSFVLTVIFVVLYITSIVRRRKLEHAILDMQKILNEMNERDKERSAPASPRSAPAIGGSNDVIAATETTKQA